MTADACVLRWNGGTLLNTLLRLTLKNETAFSWLPMPVFYDGTDDSVKYTFTPLVHAISSIKPMIRACNQFKCSPLSIAA